ncbi:IclR family transcriptional regulator [Saccharopolyspora sp. K220]|uniref:IclR family transcriptional regulator n=1 Tax=Saccharopolyspora soli TaxID=2926618 RepID=UPI001F5812BB|nr:IclR family transcriptional regulator [Saccharopolyspora soli]MCI2416897.1 IclR family transcriptional regulator [Saccharopolyspora soli]
MTSDATSHRPDRSSVQSIDRAVAILRCFDVRRPDLGISDLARRTGLSTSTVHRLLLAMQENGLVRQTIERRYALGPLVVQLARSGGIPDTLRGAAMPVLHRLRDAHEETAAVHELLPSAERVVIEQVESRHELRRTYTEFGMPVPLPQGAPGKVLLAFLPWDQQVAVLAEPIEQITPQTITDPETLAAQLAETRIRGFATSMSERTPGIRTVAAPIFDFGARVVGCLSVSGPEMRMPLNRMEQLGPDVLAAAWSVSELLGATAEERDRCTAQASAPAR